MAEPRPSTDEESAPLLAAENGHTNGNPDASGGFFAYLATATQEPLTLLSKALLGATLFFLILSSVFIGLFAGAEHRLSSGHGRHDTITITTTDYATKISTTDIRTTTTSTVVSTSTVTTTEILPAPTPTHVPHEKPCLTAQCIKLSAEILSSLDETQDPCEDFYQYANGGWLAAHPLPASKPGFGQFDAVSQGNLQIIREIIAAPLPTPAHSPDAVSMRKLKDMFTSCMDEKTLEKLGQEPLLEMTRDLRKLLSGDLQSDLGSAQRPLRRLASDDDDTVSKVGLTAALSFLHSRGIPSLFWFEVDGDVGVDPDFMTLQFYQEGTGLPSKEYYEEESVTTLYTKTVERVLHALDEDSPESSSDPKWRFWPPFPWPPWGDDGGEKPENKTAKAIRLAKAVVEFETSLAKAGLDLDVLFQDPIATYNPVAWKNFTHSLKQIDFPWYLSSFATRTFPEKVIVTYPPYLDSLSNLLGNTSSEVLEAYFVSRIGLSLADYLSAETEIWQAKRQLDELLKGLKKGAVEDREEWCLRRVENSLGFAAGRFFVEEAFGGDSRTKAAKVIDDIIASFKVSLPHLGWMDETSAAAAAGKASAIRVKVGYPLSPNTTDAKSIAGYYRLVKPDAGHFFKTVVSALVSEQSKKWAELGRKRNKDAWEMFPSTVNAYFNPPANEIVFPAGILRPPFFSQDWPLYLQYAAFGSVAAHELTHAFDSAGRMYNQQGKLEEWWTNKTSDAFNERQACIAEQYSKYTIDDGKGGKIHVNGNLTSGENIGDAGLIYAYRAWKQQHEGSLGKSEYLLPGLNKFTREQLFFIGYGRIWARNMQIAAAVQRVRTDPHSPAQYRVEGTLSNIPEFAAAFNCSAKAKMNPPKRCELWA